MIISTRQKFKKGFGILEVLVAAVIIITILSVLVFLGRSALANSQYAQEKAQAIYLAQEGIERIRQIRDTNWIDGTTTQFDDLVWKDANYNALIPATDSVDYFLYQNPAKKWGLKEVVSVVDPVDDEVRITDSSSNAPKIYRRDIQINYLSNPSDLVKNLVPGSGVNDVSRNTQSYRVTVKVTWSNNGLNNKSVSVSEILTNWRPNF